MYALNLIQICSISGLLPNTVSQIQSTCSQYLDHVLQMELEESLFGNAAMSVCCGIEITEIDVGFQVGAIDTSSMGVIFGFSGCSAKEQRLPVHSYRVTCRYNGI